MTVLWREDPDFVGRFHPEYPDDLQVVVHEGSWRFTKIQPELMWATLTSRLEWTHQDGKVGYVYKGVLINQPHQLTTLKLGDEILLRARKGYPYAVRMTHQTAMELDYAEITPCTKCGLPFMFDPPTAFIKSTYSGMIDQLINEAPAGGGFVSTHFCPVCGPAGQLFIKLKIAPLIVDNLRRS
jgi:hypothetical protein